MTAPEVELREAWIRLAGTGHQPHLDHLLGLLRQAHRRYHTATHVMWVIRHVDEIAATCVVHDLAAVHAAALFHDAIYDPRSPTNEADSAALAVRVLVAIGWPPDRCLAVRRSIEATAHHTPVGAVHTLDTDVLLDADLAILASAPAVYTAYAAGVRSEYSHVSDAEWRTGRASFLHRVLVADAIFRTPMMRIDHEPRARSNLAAELSSLQPGQ